MGKEPDEIRVEIERTRQGVGQNVDALTEKVSPTRIVGRRVERTRGAVTGLRDRVMGTASNATSSTSQRASSTAADVRDAVSGAPDTVRQRTEGNPLAAGLIAFGLGWLVSSLFPASQVEEKAADKAQQAAQPVMQKAGQAAQEMKENLREPAQQAAQQVKQTASDAAGTVAGEGKSAGQSVTEEAKISAQSVKESSSSGGA